MPSIPAPCGVSSSLTFKAAWVDLIDDGAAQIARVASIPTVDEVARALPGRFALL